MAASAAGVGALAAKPGVRTSAYKAAASGTSNPQSAGVFQNSSRLWIRAQDVMTPPPRQLRMAHIFHTAATRPVRISLVGFLLPASSGDVHGRPTPIRCSFVRGSPRKGPDVNGHGREPVGKVPLRDSCAPKEPPKRGRSSSAPSERTEACAPLPRAPTRGHSRRPLRGGGRDLRSSASPKKCG